MRAALHETDAGPVEMLRFGDPAPPFRTLVMRGIAIRRVFDYTMEPRRAQEFGAADSTWETS